MTGYPEMMTPLNLIYLPNMNTLFKMANIPACGRIEQRAQELNERELARLLKSDYEVKE